MANPDHLAKLKEGVNAWNEWRSESRVEAFRSEDSTLLRRLILSRADLCGADLAGAHLKRVIFSDADLAQADLSGAKLTKADLSKANLRRAKLRTADLSGADLSNADLTGADLSQTDLTRVTLMSTVLNYTNLAGSIIASAIFADVDLSKVSGLDKLRHEGPSSIAIDTLVRSHGNIPEIFLRRAGAPESFITNMKALIGAMDPIQFYSCFISYSTDDQEFADRLYADLQAKGVRCWFAPHDVQGGRKLHEQIDEAIRLYDKLLLILSPHSMSSEWVKTEISKARKREVRDKARVLFPISVAPFADIRDWECFDADTGKDSAREVREYFIPDFSHWKDHDSYQKAFERLLKDLRAVSNERTNSPQS